MSRIAELKALATDNVLGVDILNAEKFAKLIIVECGAVADHDVDYGNPSDAVEKHFGLSVDDAVEMSKLLKGTNHTLY